MDPSVIQAIERWPNVPAVYGWLSLTVRGQWRLHPGGNATEATTGESISNPQILAFINRNYGHDELGRWFFQNGPQRVYVRLDGAPWIIFADDSQGKLTTHTGLTVKSVTKLWIDDLGHLYLQTEHGSGLLIDRDLPRFVQALKTTNGQPLEDWWEQAHETNTNVSGNIWRACANTLPIRRLNPSQPYDGQLGFISNPSAA
ncbi:MAG: DUF2946 family protein [Burkholderiaceae bacterium]|nr:DUF2946 family protein [Burkholderiaceae bacterium]